MKKKTILMVHNFYQIGGGEHTVYQNEVNLLRKNGHKVVEYTRSNDELKKSFFKMLLLPLTTIWSFKTYRDIKQIILQEDIDVVHCHNTFPLISPSVYYAARKEKTPIVQTIHNFRFLCPCGVFYRDGHICEDCLKNDSFKSALKNKCYRNSMIQTLVVVIMLKFHRLLGTYKKINYIFLTDFNRQKFKNIIDINADNVFIKPNFVEPPIQIEYTNTEEKVFVFAGRLDENKGIKRLIELWNYLPEEFILHIYGNGPLEDFVRQEVSKTNNIVYYGFCPRSQIFEDLTFATALVFPSLCYEGFPMIIAESMAIGCPVVATNIGNGADIVIKSKGGLTYNPDNKDDFCLTIQSVIKNNKQIRKNAAVYYRNVLSAKNNYDQLMEYYQKIRGG